jgi:hypothetical protein
MCKETAQRKHERDENIETEMITAGTTREVVKGHEVINEHPSIRRCVVVALGAGRK